MRISLVIALFITISGSLLSVQANDLLQLDNKAQASQKEQQQRDRVRTKEVIQTRSELEKQLMALKRSIKKVEKETDKLSSTFSHNEKALVELEKQLQIETGSLGEVFGVVRQGATTSESTIMASFIQPSEGVSVAPIKTVINTEALPSITVLAQYVDSMVAYIQQSKNIALVNVNRVQGDGIVIEEPMLRIGDMGLLSNQGYMKWDRTQSQAESYTRYPEDVPTQSNVNTSSLLIDVTRGELLTQYSEQPTLVQRIEQAGIVGQVILGLLAIGLVISLYRGVALLRIQMQIIKQMKSPNEPGNNPLGRILSVYDKEKRQTLESLELRLLETIMDEQQGLEKGLSMLKLLAALAPMLGLLGTVTGMIETFQVITQFGNGDPKVMAGGISMALTTTVLGLVAAMPLLLAHNLLSSRADSINAVLEKQGVSLVAAKAEIDNA